MVWRIFSKLWPPRETPPPQAAGEDQAEHRVAAHWMSVLRQAWHALYKENVANRDLASRLCALKDAQLIELDPAIRGRYRDDTSWGRGQAIEVVSVTPHSSIDAEREAQWFVAACDADGFVRERALQAFLECPGKLALPVALIRCDDWVDAVRAAALRLLRHVLEIGEADPFAHLDMLLLLRRRQRFAQETWSALIEPFLLDGSRGQARWDATRSKSSRVRLLAYSLIQRAEPQRLHEACLQALEDPDPIVARWGLATGSENADLAQLTELVQRGSTHPRSSLRTQALRLRAAHGLPGTREAMQAALFDVSRTARGAAVHFLRNDASVDPVQLWRDAVSAGDSKRTRVALDALAPVAKQEDVALLLPWLAHPAGRVRATALRGLLTAQVPELPARLELALADPSIEVVRTAIKFLRHKQHLCTAGLFRHAYAAAASPRTRASIARAAMLAGKWETLDLYLSWYLPASHGERAVLAHAIDAWIAVDVRRFTPLPAPLRMRLQELLAQTPPSGSPLDLARLAHIIAHA